MTANKLGNAKILWRQLRMSDGFYAQMKNKALIARRYRRHYTWDCAKPDTGFTKWNKTITLEPAIHPFALTPMGQINQAQSAKRMKALLGATGLKDIQEVDKEIVAMFGRRTYKVDITPFKKLFTSENKVAVYVWTSYIDDILMLPGATAKDDPIEVLTVSNPTSISIEAFITGYCLENAPKPPRKRVMRTVAISSTGRTKDQIATGMAVIGETFDDFKKRMKDGQITKKDQAKRTSIANRIDRWRSYPKH